MNTVSQDQSPSNTAVKSGQRRVVSRFSCGAASAVATKLALKKYGDRVVIAYSDPGSEHPDNRRFLRDCEAWWGRKVEVLRSDKYADTWSAWEGERFIASKDGAPCTRWLKRATAEAFQDISDVLVFGYTADKPDAARARRIRAINSELRIETPLIDAGLTKADCLGMIRKAGIVLPAMYQLGYRNNNCIGCPKGGMGYWNKIRADFPDTFKRMEALQEKLGPGSAFLKDADGSRILLKDLAASRGDYPSEPDIECSLLCHIAEQDLGGAA